MSSSLVRRAVALAAVLGALGLAGPAAAATVRGVVVHHNARAHSFTVALPSGRLIAVHARHSPRIGQEVSVSARPLRNGTLALRSLRAGRLTRRVLIHGVVTFADRRAGMFTVSGEGASVLVQTSPTSGTVPSVGEDVNVEAQIDNQGDLQEEGVQTTGTQTQNMDLEGTILAIDTTARTLTVSADDDQQSGQSVTVNVPSTIDMTQFAVGQEVELTVTMQSPGVFTLVSPSEDGNSQQANQPSSGGSDSQNGSNQGGSDGSGSSTGSGGPSGD
jgi:uncharacterized membrane protein YgcG